MPANGPKRLSTESGTHFRDHERHVFHDSGFRLASQSPTSRRDERPRRRDCGVHLCRTSIVPRYSTKHRSWEGGKAPNRSLSQTGSCLPGHRRDTYCPHVVEIFAESFDGKIPRRCARCRLSRNLHQRAQPHTVLWHSVDDIRRSRAVSALVCRRGHQAQLPARPSRASCTEAGRPMAGRLLRSLPAASFVANNRQAFAKPVAAAR